MGAVTTKTSSIDEWLHHCIRCGNCKYVFREYSPSCPSGDFFKFETYFASGRLWLARGISKKEINWDSSVQKALFACTTCSSCQQQCLAPQKEHIVDIIEEMREAAVEALGPLPEHQRFAANIKRVHNPYGEPHHNMKMRTVHELPEKAEYVYFIGCTSNYREEQIRDATISLLKKAKVNFTVVNEFCCGSPLLRTGQSDAVEHLAAHNLREISSTEARVVITSCAGCYRTLKKDYPKLGFEHEFEALHLSHLLEELLASNKLKVTTPAEQDIIVYHDPCHLGRHMEVYDEPRSILKQVGVHLVEMDSNRENAWCCGAGGGVKSAYDELSLATAKHRIEEAKDIAATGIVTACPFCVRNLRDGSHDSSICVSDLSEIVDRLV